jgi:hypothetical protein
MVIRISRRTFRIVFGVLVGLGILAGLYALGQALTPRDAAGRPVFLSPSVWATERYRRTAQGWLARMERLDAGIEAALEQTDLSDPAALYAASDRAQGLVTEAARLVQETEFTPAPLALGTLRDLARSAAAEYWNAASATARWVGAPEESARDEARAALGKARQARRAFAQSRWLR